MKFITNLKNNLARTALTLLLAVLTTSAWAIQQDPDDGYYLIGSSQDWQDFATGISDGTIATNANARLTADNITVSTMIGTSSKIYAGTFDGNYKTITANISGTAGFEAPFGYIQNATIKNLTVSGTVNGAIHCAGLVGTAWGTNSISNILMTATITTTGSHCGGVIGHGQTSTMTLRDCLFSGTINGRSAGSTVGAIWGWSDNATANIYSCLENGSYTNCSSFNPISQGNGTRNISATYYVNAKTGGNAYGLLATSEQLASGEITYKLQSNRGDLVWGQTIATQNLPKLHLFDNTALRVYRTIDGYSNNPEEALLSQDSDGYFLIGTSDDWRALAMLVDEMEQGVNAKMTADIDLGDAQVMVGDGYYPNAQYRRPFRGIFDGQGHTLTIHYVTESIAAGYTDAGLAVPGYLGCAPFGYVWNGTIRNLHTAGTITSTHEGVAGIVGWTNGVVLIENCHSSVDITYTNGARGMAGITYNNYHDNHNLTIQDCIYDGILTAGTTKTGAAGFVVVRASGNVYIKNSLLAATFANGLGSGDCATFVRNNFGSGYISNSHFKTALGTIQGNQATADELANGRTAFYLQNGRTELVWGQEIGVDPLPVLTSDESKRVYRSATGYTNDPTQAIPDQSLQPFSYTCNANNELTITGFDPGFTPPANYTLVIPDEIDGNLVVYIADNAFNSKTNFTSLTIGRNVKTIGLYAFTNCTAMTSISLPADGALETINQCAFENCSNLVSIVLPNTVKTLGVNVLKSCTNLTSVTISNQLATIPNETFRNCTHLNNVVIPSSVTTINNNVFWDCDALTSITIPNSVTALGTNVFRSCGELSSVTFEEGCQLTTIPNEVFRECSSLTGITIPLSITTIGSSAFNGSALTSITFPSNVTRINNSAFASCANLTEVTIPSTITTVESYAFQSCGLESANVYCHTIGAHMFYNCTELENITISDGIETISDNAFQNCSKLTSISIPSSVTTINSAAFAGCTLLANVTMADGINITSLPQYLFSGDSHLTSFTIPTSVTTIGQCAFENCTLLNNMVIPNSVTTLGDYVFKGCTNLESVTISNQVTTLPFEAFRNCTHLNNVTIPSSVTTINNNAFYDCDALTSITIPNSVTTIGTSVFQSCGLLAEVSFEDGCQLTSIPNNTFYQCSSLTGITIPSSVKTIGNSAFRYCTSLNNVVLHGGLTSIQDWSFANCTAMENLTIEEGVTSINRDVFQYSGMKNVVLPSTLGAIGINLFYNCNQLQTLDVSKCVNVWELYYYTSLRGYYTIFYGVPTATKIILPPYAQATLGANDEIATLAFDLTADSEGYYLINTADDWDKFVVYSRANPTVNGRITTDIDLTSHVGKLGVGSNESNYITYQGTIDGQGHTLTIQYRTAQDVEGGLFAYVENATIQNLKVNGTITANHRLVGGFVGFVKPASTLTMQDCESNVNFTVTPSTTNMHIAGFIGQGKTSTITLTDCLYNGTITGVSSFRYAAPFLGWKENSGTITYNYCLNNGDFVNLDKNYTYALGATQNNGQSTAVNCYYRSNNVTNNESLAQSVSDAQLESGYVTFRLQGTRPEQHWGQLLGTDLFPRLTDEEGTRIYRGQTYTNEPTAYTGLLQDEDGYYLIGGTADWEEFCIVVEEFPLSNARMTNDVTVVDNTMIGDVTTPYSGIFDGQGHTLTINYDRTGLAYSQSMDYGAAPFLFIRNATIKNLHVDGSIHTSTKFAAGVVGDVQGTQSLIEKCRSSVNITSSVNGEGCMGGVVSHLTNNQTVIIRDCRFDGSFDAANAWGNGGIMGYKNGTATIENCLFAPSALSLGANNSYCIMRQGAGTTTINNCYYTQQLGTVQGTLANAEQLASGYTAYKLQNRRDELVWGQTIGTHPQPVLVVFDNTALRVYRSIDGYSNNPDAGVLAQDEEGYYLISSVAHWQLLAMLVDEGENDANARMTADIDLGDDQTMIGTNSNRYAGTFDGQGHTLVANITSQAAHVAPFSYIENATIKNLKVSGTINGDIHCAGLVGSAWGTNSISNILMTATITTTGSHCGGVIGHGQTSTTTISDCLFSGTINGCSAGSKVGAIWGWSDNNAKAYISHSFEHGSYTNCSSFNPMFYGNGSYYGDGNFYCYNSYAGNNPGTWAPGYGLNHGTVAQSLQYAREELVWVHDPRINEPMLVLFIYTDAFNGNGSEDNPFIISTTAELDMLAYLTNNVMHFYGKYFKLGADIAYDPNVLTIDNDGDGVNDSNYTPIGTDLYYNGIEYYPHPSFNGYFDGNGHTISGIRIYRPYQSDRDCNQGVFGRITSTSYNDTIFPSICNLTVADTEITGFEYIGGIVGLNSWHATIENCHVADNVVLHVIQPGSKHVGGIAGYTNGNVTHCSSAVTITITEDASSNANYFGGLVGTNAGPDLTNNPFSTLANNLVINATIPAIICSNNYQYSTKSYGAILGWDYGQENNILNNYYYNCTVAGVPNATNVGCGGGQSPDDPFDLYDNNGAVPGYLHNVTGYGNSTESDHWAFIASPVTTEGGIAPTAVGNLIADPIAEYDLYRFNQSASMEWENYKNPTHTTGFTLENGKGYLYANKKNVTLAFAGTINTDSSMDVDLDYDVSATFAGYNLVGNPFLTEAVINKNYYTMNAQGSGIVAEEVNSSEPIPPFTGVIVQATDENQTVTFTKATRQSTAPNQGNLQIAVAQANTRDNAIEDNAIVSFNEGSLLGKFYFGKPRANIYIPKSHEEYAIAYSDGHGEMPINFRANENGQYTITVNPENVEMAYLHLIDNMTGADVDLLQTPEYTFTAKTTDYESRFRLVFSICEDANGDNETFAFINNGNIIINGEGTVQVVDMMGRIVYQGDAKHCVSTTGMAPGVYVIRLINGDNVKTQKMVVR